MVSPVQTRTGCATRTHPAVVPPSLWAAPRRRANTWGRTAWASVPAALPHTQQPPIPSSAALLSVLNLKLRRETVRNGPDAVEVQADVFVAVLGC